MISDLRIPLVKYQRTRGRFKLKLNSLLANQLHNNYIKSVTIRTNFYISVFHGTLEISVETTRKSDLCLVLIAETIGD